MVDLPFGVGRNLGARRAPFLDATNGESGIDQQVEIARERAVLLHHALGQPVGRTRTFVEIVGAGLGLERMLGREDEASARHQRAMHQGQKTRRDESQMDLARLIVRLRMIAMNLAYRMRRDVLGK